MSLETRLNRNIFTGNGTTTVFDFTFKAWETDQIKVAMDAGDGEQDVTDLVTITVNETVGGSVTFTEAPSAGTAIAVYRAMPFIQEDRYISGTRIDPHEFEDRFDQDCAERQELKDGLDRAIKVPLTSDKTAEEYLAELQQLMAEVKRLIGILEMSFLANGLTCVERTWTLPTDTPAGTLITLPDNLWYIVGRYHVRLSYDGIVLDHTRWLEVGSPNTISTDIISKCSFPAGTELNVWISHLAADEGEADSQQNAEIAALQTAVGALNDSLAELSRNVVYRTAGEE